MNQIRKLVTIACIIMICCFFGGCKSQKTQEDKLKDIEFTVLKESEIPQELKNSIEERKQNEFKLTFYDKEKKDYLYIVVGYGKQSTGGYSIAVEDLYLTNNSIYIDTSLVGPAKDDVVSQAITYPYVVVKIEFIEKPVTFI